MKYLPQICIDLPIKWHGIGGRTISKVIRHDLGIVETFAPEIVVLQLGTNDLSSHSRTYLVCYRTQMVCKGSVFARLFFAVMLLYLIAKFKLLTKYLKIVLEPIPYVLYWRRRGFWNCKSRFLTRDGVHLNHLGQYKFFRSLRGAVLQCLQTLQANG